MGSEMCIRDRGGAGLPDGFTVPTDGGSGLVPAVGLGPVLGPIAMTNVKVNKNKLHFAAVNDGKLVLVVNKLK